MYIYISIQLRSGSTALGEGTKDFARLPTILGTHQVFDIVAEPEVLQARQELAAAIEPQVISLLKKADIELSRLERKEKSLSAKADLQQVRLEQLQNNSKQYQQQQQQQQQINNDNDNDNVNNNKNNEYATNEQIEELKQLQQERDRLKYAKSRADLQKRQKRMSVAFRRD